MTLSTARATARPSHLAGSDVRSGTARRGLPLADAMPSDLSIALLGVPLIECLESRRLMDGITQNAFAATLTGNLNTPNTFDIRVVGRGVAMTVNDTTRWCDYGPNLTFKIVGGNAADRVTVDDGVGVSVLVDAKAGDDSIKTGAGNDAINAGAGRDAVNGSGGYDLAVDAELVSNIEFNTTGTSNPPTPPPPPTPTPNPGNGLPASMRRDGTHLYVTGSPTAANTIRVTLDAAGTRLLVQANADVASFNTVDVKWVVATGGAQADLIEADLNVPVSLAARGEGGNDTLRGGGLADNLIGGPGDDTIDARAGSDWAEGQDGRDAMFGGTGADTLNGGAGDDQLDGGEWADTLIGGDGYDVGSNGESYQSVEQIGGTPPPPTPPPTPTPTPPPPTPPPTPPTPGPTGAGLPPITGNVPSPVARITSPTGLSVIAGQAVHVDGLTSSLNAGQPTTARYEWDFGDAAGRFNKLVGFNASHAYDRAGTYTVTLRVINEGGRTSTTSAAVTVAADNRPAIYVSQYGNDAHAGTLDRPIRTLTRAAAMVYAASDVKILFKRGETFDVSTTALWIRGRNVSVGAYGTAAARPLLRYNGPRDQQRYLLVVDPGAQNTTIENLTFDSIYTAPDGDVANMPCAIMIQGRNTLVRNSTVNDVGYATNVAGSSVGTMVLDNVAPKATGIRAYFMWAEGQNVVAAGNAVANSTREHIIRLSGASKVLVYGNDLTNLDRSNVDARDNAKGVVNAQRGSYYYVANNRLNGPSAFGPLGGADGTGQPSARMLYGVFEANYQANGPLELRHGAEHTVVRNNVLDRDNLAAITIEGFNTAYQRGVADLTIVNNTALNDATYGNFIVANTPIDGIRILNNLYVAPRLTTGDFGTAAIAVIASNLSSFTQIDGNNWSMPVTGWWADGGVNMIGAPGNDRTVYQTPAEWNGQAQVGTDFFIDVNVDGSYRPYGGQAGVDVALEVGGVFTDYYGNYRPQTGWSVGAVQG